MPRVRALRGAFRAWKSKVFRGDARKSLVRAAATGSQDDRSTPARARADALFDVLAHIRSSDIPIVPLTEVDRYIAARKPAVFLKHDVHDVDLGGLTAFARREVDAGIKGSYFFMVPGHPRTRGEYGFGAQASAMREIQELGHEVGIHIDPYFMVHERGASLAECLQEVIEAFSREGVECRIGNMHGNSKHKHKDLSGYGTSFDLFSELGRQSDFPTLSNVPDETARIIRSNRVSIADHGFTHWGDMPMWSARNGFVGMNFLTDNSVGKTGEMRVVLRPETSGSYYLAPSQPPGSVRLAPDGRQCDCNLHASWSRGEPIDMKIELGDGSLKGAVSRNGAIAPLLVLVHPEFYC